MTPEETAAVDHFHQLLDEASAPWSLHVRLIIGACIAALVALALVAFWPDKPIREVITAAPMVVQADKSVIAERAPDAHPKPPPHIIPKGGVEVRRDSFVAAPSPGASSVQIDLSLVRMPDNGQRVVASSPDGTIVSAIDVPIVAGLMPPAPKKWAAGLSYDTDRAAGVWLERDIGRLRLGAEVAKGAGKPRAEIRVGVAF